jgi:hypothetical protein
MKRQFSLKAVFFTAVMTSIVAFGSLTLAKPYNPKSLSDLIETVRIEAAKGQSPVVMFDLDDTLTNTRDRTARILHDFANQPEIKSAFPEESKKIESLEFAETSFLLGDTMKAIDIDNAAFIQKANDFWLAHFFTNKYCAKDIETTGASVYLHKLANAGAKIVYMTGRDIPRMGKGTKENLIRNHFPVKRNFLMNLLGRSDETAVLILKPDAKEDDLVFKESQYANIAAMGEVVGAFENEPANINSMANAFPHAAAIFLDTIHSPKPDVPEDRVEWVENFVLPAGN